MKSPSKRTPFTRRISDRSRTGKSSRPRASRQASDDAWTRAAVKALKRHQRERIAWLLENNVAEGEALRWLLSQPIEGRVR